MAFTHLLLCSICIFFVLYAPQPLLAVFTNTFNITTAQSGSLMSLTMLPLAIAPIFYGLILAKRNVLQVLKWTMFALAFSCLAFVWVEPFIYLQGIRLLQGLLLPAALTSMTGYVAMQFQGTQVQKKMAFYIGSTIIGGYLGRVLAASFASWFSWQSFYYFMAIVLCVFAMFIQPSRHQTQIKPYTSPKEYLRPLHSKPVLTLYLGVFSMFFCFAGLMNFLPFILGDWFNITNTKDVGLVYTGYLLGAALSSSATWLVKRCRSAAGFIFTIFVLYVFTLVFMQIPTFSVFISAFTLFCMAMFMIHTTAAGYANQISQAPATVTNGAYVSFYYSGGALGSFLPGYAYDLGGVSALLWVLTAVAMFGALATQHIHK
ncbi:putative transport protein (MFS family) [Pseudoalteromonas luteoviolacea B = ATCC 29581]|nr:putative transport protein (MFS family) [Pseudoalteromonas luteoviolacea B = ATCC 29581]